LLETIPARLKVVVVDARAISVRGAAKECHCPSATAACFTAALDLAGMEEAPEGVAALPTPSRPTVLALLDGN
jgi:hypothetical protein